MDTATRTAHIATAIRITLTAPPFHSDSVTRITPTVTRTAITAHIRTTTATDITLMIGPVMAATPMGLS
jgi:hypothetical protein